MDEVLCNQSGRDVCRRAGSSAFFGVATKGRCSSWAHTDILIGRVFSCYEGAMQRRWWRSQPQVM